MYIYLLHLLSKHYCGAESIFDNMDGLEDFILEDFNLKDLFKGVIFHPFYCL